MAIYDFKCRNQECKLDRFALNIPMAEYDASMGVCPECGQVGSRFMSTMPGVHYKGLGFYATDQAYAQQLKEAEAIADASYNYRADNCDDKLSKDDDWWQELAKQEFEKEVPKGRVYSAPPPTTVIPANEAKASTTIASGGTTTNWKDSSS